MQQSLLSQREIEVIETAANGFSDKEVATRLGVSSKTIRTYWVRIREKLAAHNHTHAVALYYQSMATVGHRRESQQVPSSDGVSSAGG